MLLDCEESKYIQTAIEWDQPYQKCHILIIAVAYMGTCELLNMYACSPQALGMHLRKITCAHVTTIQCLTVRRNIANHK